MSSSLVDESRARSNWYSAPAAAVYVWWSDDLEDALHDLWVHHRWIMAQFRLPKSPPQFQSESGRTLRMRIRDIVGENFEGDLAETITAIKKVSRVARDDQWMRSKGMVGFADILRPAFIGKLLARAYDRGAPPAGYDNWDEFDEELAKLTEGGDA